MTWKQRVQMVLTLRTLKSFPTSHIQIGKLHTVTQKTEMFVFQWDVNVNVFGGKTIEIMYLPNGKWDNVDLCI